MSGNWGMLAAVGMFILTAISLVFREIRYRTADQKQDTIDATKLQAVIETFKNQIEELFKDFRVLDQDRQKHELECAKIQERLSSRLDTVTKTQERVVRALDNLERQIGNIARDKLEFKPDDPDSVPRRRR